MQDLYTSIELFIQGCRNRNCKNITLEAYFHDLTIFSNFLEKSNIAVVEHITSESIESFWQFLIRSRRPRSVQRIWRSLALWCKDQAPHLRTMCDSFKVVSLELPFVLTLQEIECLSKALWIHVQKGEYSNDAYEAFKQVFFEKKRLTDIEKETGISKKSIIALVRYLMRSQEAHGPNIPLHNNFNRGQQQETRIGQEEYRRRHPRSGMVY